MLQLTDGREVLRPDAISLTGLSDGQEWLLPVTWPDGSSGYARVNHFRQADYQEAEQRLYDYFSRDNVDSDILINLVGKKLRFNLKDTVRNLRFSDEDLRG